MIIQTLFKNQKFIFFLLALALGIFLFFPYHNFQLHLAQGDHGRDLYCFKKTLDGGVPYRDYWWPYGPLMPYYYAAFYKLFGTNIHSVLLGYHLWDILCGLAVFGTLAIFFTPILALTGAVWYWVFFPPFEYTYNHAGGIFAILLTIYFLAVYIKKGGVRNLYGGLAAIFALFFIKLNFGFSMLVAFVLAVGLIDYAHKASFAKKRLFYFMSLIGLPFLAGIIYYGIVHELPLYYIRQCFPYFGADRPFNPTIGEVIKSFFDHSLLNPNSHWTNWLMAFLSGISFLYIIIRWKKLATDKAQQKQFILLMVALIVISLFNLHEFLLSAVYYRTSWVKPSHIVAMFALIAFVLDNIPRIGKWFVCVLILCSAFHGHYMRSTFVSYLKVPFQFINLPRGQVYIGNVPPWLDTVTKATEHLTATLGENETFLAVVDDPLYYFLAEKDSPTRQLAFCNHLNIHINQELEIISKLENDNINYVLLSNKAFLKDNYMGTFGVTYCPLLAAYIRDNFSLSMSFGDWNQEPSWYAGHAVMVLKRK